MEDNNKTKRLSEAVEQEYKNLAKNSFYSFIHSYSGFFFSTITSFLMAKIVSQETWGFLILSLSIIAIFTLTLAFLPPSLGLSFNYYIPKYRALNQNTKLKSFIKNSLIIRILFIIPTFFISLLIIYILIEFLSINLGNYEFLLYLLAPLVIINGLHQVFFDILRGFNLFKIVYYLLIIRNTIHIGGLVFLFLNINLVSLENVALIILFSYLVPFTINLVIILRLQIKIKRTEEEALAFKQVFKSLIKYGTNLSIKTYLDKFNREFKTILVGTLEPIGTVTGYNIAVHYSDVSFEAIGSFNRPLTISFSSLSAKNKIRQIEAIYKNLFQYALLLILIITGILFFIIDIYLHLIYSEYRESFQLYSMIMKLLIIAMIFNTKASFFYSLLRASDKVKYMVPIRLMNFLIQFSAFLISLMFFGIIGGIIGIIFGNLISFFILTFFNFKLFKIKMDMVKAILLYLIFFCSLGISLFFETLFLSEFNSFILQSLNLSIFRSFQFLSLISFLVIFLFFLIILKIFSLPDIQSLELIFNRKNFTDKTIRRSLNFLKKFVRR